MIKFLKGLFKLIFALFILILIATAIFIVFIRKPVAKKILRATLDTINSCDFTQDFYYIDSDGRIAKNLMLSNYGYVSVNKTTFEIKDFDFDGIKPHAVATLTVEYPNLFERFKATYENYNVVLSSEDIDNFMIDQLQNNKFSYVTEDISVDILQYGTKFYLVQSDELLNVYTGNMLNGFLELSESEVAE